MKSEYAKIADDLLAGIKPYLKTQNFKSSGRTFNRTTHDGLIQVINLQMGAADPPGTTYHPGLRENLHGFFTINLGVHVPEVSQYRGGGLPKGFVKEYQCCIRQRLGNIGAEMKMENLWWPLSGDSEIASEILLRINRDAMPYLERFSIREKILLERPCWIIQCSILFLYQRASVSPS